jgi:hypothetical protein
MPAASMNGAGRCFVRKRARASASNILNPIERFEAQKERCFGISPETAPLVIEALRVYARMHAGEPAKYKVERWDRKDSHVEEIVASASLIMIGQAAFPAAVEQYPRSRLALRQGDPE